MDRRGGRVRPFPACHTRSGIEASTYERYAWDTRETVAVCRSQNKGIRGKRKAY